MDWTEIVVTVSSGAVEAVANFIHEAGAGGVVIEHLDNHSSNVTAYFPVGEETESVLARLEELWNTLAGLDIEADPKISTKVVLEQDWAEEWKRHYKPVQVGNIYITPSWLEHEPLPDEITIELDPGMAFGTGTHATTQMCIAEINASINPGDTVLDLGSGSGILSIAAAKLGAKRVDAVDNDRVAVKVATENAQRNNCMINPSQGDAFAVFRASHHSIVVANIGYNACAKLARIYLEENKQSTLILSGFPQERISELTDEVEVNVVRTRTSEGWGCLVIGPQQHA